MPIVIATEPYNKLIFSEGMGIPYFCVAMMK